MQCLSQLITKEQTHLSKIWDTVQTCRQENAILLVWSQDKYSFNFYEFLKLSRACDIVENNIAKISLFVMFIIIFIFLVSPFLFLFFLFFYGLTHQPLPVTRHPPTANRQPPPATRGNVCRLKINKVRTALFKGTFFNRLPYLWNNLPDKLRTSNLSLSLFKKQWNEFYKKKSFDPDHPHITWM